MLLGSLLVGVEITANEFAPREVKKKETAQISTLMLCSWAMCHIRSHEDKGWCTIEFICLPQHCELTPKIYSSPGSDSSEDNVIQKKSRQWIKL